MNSAGAFADACSFGDRVSGFPSLSSPPPGRHPCLCRRHAKHFPVSMFKGSRCKFPPTPPVPAVCRSRKAVGVVAVVAPRCRFCDDVRTSTQYEPSAHAEEDGRMRAGVWINVCFLGIAVDRRSPCPRPSRLDHVGCLVSSKCSCFAMSTLMASMTQRRSRNPPRRRNWCRVQP